MKLNCLTNQLSATLFLLLPAGMLAQTNLTGKITDETVELLGHLPDFIIVAHGNLHCKVARTGIYIFKRQHHVIERKKSSLHDQTYNNYRDNNNQKVYQNADHLRHEICSDDFLKIIGQFECAMADDE